MNMKNIFILVFMFLLISLNLLFLLHDYNHSMQQFSWLAEGFISGHLFAITDNSYDMVSFNGKLYWPQGPFPAVLIAGFKIIFGSGVQQGIAQIVLFIVILFLCYLLAKDSHFSDLDALILSGVFCFGTVMIGLLSSPSSWYFSQVVSVAFTLMSWWVWKKYKSPFLTGILLSCVLASRPIAAAFIFICLSEILFSSVSSKRKFVIGFQLILPMLCMVLTLFAYNFARFGDILNNGYLINNIDERTRIFMNEGLFSPRHMMRNIYWYFLATPNIVLSSLRPVFPYLTYNEWGISLIIIQPFFLYTLYSIGTKKIEIRVAWITVLLSLILLLNYFNTGWSSFGPRYTADFLPALYMILLQSLPSKGLSTRHKIIALTSMTLNTYLVFSTTVYPSLY